MCVNAYGNKYTRIYNNEQYKRTCIVLMYALCTVRLVYAFSTDILHACCAHCMLKSSPYMFYMRRGYYDITPYVCCAPETHACLNRIFTVFVMCVCYVCAKRI